MVAEMKGVCRIGLAFLCCLLAVAASASAEEGYLESVGEWIPVWRSPSVVSEGTGLQYAGHLALAAQRMACLVNAGTRVIGPNAGGEFLTRPARVVVVEGDAKGCTGYVEGPMFIGKSSTRAGRPMPTPSPCWTTAKEMAAIKAAVDGGNPTEAGELSSKARERTKTCVGR